MLEVAVPVPRERPIIYSAPMILAERAGLKTQTRRKVKLPSVVCPRGGWKAGRFGGEGLTTAAGEVIPEQGCIWHTGTGQTLTCPYGAPGDRLWVRETCRAIELPSGLDVVHYVADGADVPIEDSFEGAERWLKLHTYRGKKGATVPPIHMPRWASRTLLEITETRVQRLQEISEADALAEGIEAMRCPDCHLAAYGLPGWGHDQLNPTAQGAYRYLWESINGAGSWDLNPLVWCVSFRRLEAANRS